MSLPFHLLAVGNSIHLGFDHSKTLMNKDFQTASAGGKNDEISVQSEREHSEGN